MSMLSLTSNACSSVSDVGSISTLHATLEEGCVRNCGYIVTPNTLVSKVAITSSLAFAVGRGVPTPFSAWHVFLTIPINILMEFTPLLFHLLPSTGGCNMLFNVHCCHTFMTQHAFCQCKASTDAPSPPHTLFYSKFPFSWNQVMKNVKVLMEFHQKCWSVLLHIFHDTFV